MPRQKLVDEEHVMSLTVPGLKKLCKKYKIPTRGLKADLQEAVLEHLNLGKYEPAAAKKEGTESKVNPGKSKIEENPVDMEPAAQAASAAVPEKESDIFAAISEKEPDVQLEPQPIHSTIIEPQRSEVKSKQKAVSAESSKKDEKPTGMELEQKQEHPTEIKPEQIQEQPTETKPEQKHEQPRETAAEQGLEQPTEKIAEQVQQLSSNEKADQVQEPLSDEKLVKVNCTIVSEPNDRFNVEEAEGIKVRTMDLEGNVPHDSVSNQKRSIKESKQNAVSAESSKKDEQPTGTELEQKREHLTEIKPEQKQEHPTETKPEQKHEQPRETAAEEALEQPTGKKAEQVQELPSNEKADQVQEPPPDEKLEKVNCTNVSEPKYRFNVEESEGIKEHMMDIEVNVPHDSRSSQKRSAKEAGISGKVSATKKIKIEDNIMKSGAEKSVTETTADMSIGRTKMEIEEFLKKQDARELVKLCLELSAEDPELLHVLKQEAIKTGETHEVIQRGSVITGKSKGEKSKHGKLSIKGLKRRDQRTVRKANMES